MFIPKASEKDSISVRFAEWRGGKKNSNLIKE
jgi:hypothetical protein